MPRALIVDDKPENLYFLSALLVGHGYAVDQAADGAQALASARASPPDLVISDILMPGMDGFALCRQWKQDPALRAVPFVFYTATYTDPRDERLALSLGADLFLTKPQEPDAFMGEIAAALHRHQAGRLLRPPAPAIEETSYLREYNAALIHKLEDKLVQLEQVSKVKDALLGSVSHELRTPLTPVMLLVGILLRDPDTPPRMREDLETIGRYVEIEKRLIGDLLDYAAMHSGALRLQKQTLSLHPLVQQVAALWREQLRAETLCLDLRLEAACDQVLGDRARLEQVLWNLMHDAVRRSPRGAAITVRSRSPRPGRVVLDVRDAGPAMDPQTIAWAFAPFEHGVRVGENSARDIGLGLAVSKGIIEAHDGTVAVDSDRPDVGRTVTVQLPVRPA